VKESINKEFQENHSHLIERGNFVEGCREQPQKRDARGRVGDKRP
jgi:hypothetical protein